MDENSIEISDFISKDKLNPTKVHANAEIFRKGGLEMYKASIRNDDIDLSANATPTIGRLANIMDQPLGHPMWFMIAYPDVVLWSSELEDKKALEILGNPTEDQLIDTDKKIRINFLRKIVDRYLAEGNILETK